MPEAPLGEVLAAARRELGLAVGARAHEVGAEVRDRMAPHTSTEVTPSQAYTDHRAARSVVASLLIARWLYTGQAADEDEKRWIERGGALAATEGIPIVETTRGYVFWRSVLSRVVREEAVRLETPAEVVAEVLGVIEGSADSSMMRMARSYDAELRRINQELREANAFKSEFLAKMSHELRTPLSAIIGFSEILLEGVDGDLNEEQRSDVDQIHRSGRSLLELINDVLDLSKIEAGRMVVASEPVDLAAVTADVMTTMRPIASEKGLELAAEVPAGSMVVGDALRIRQVLTNLVSNAVKFTERGAVTIRSEVRGSHLAVSVQDTGIGIPPEARDRIFDEFRQADARVAQTYGGTGLGLAISRKLCELQGGRLEVESEVGRGSRFWFTLPLLATPAAAEVPSVTAAADPRWPSQTQDLVLVVDDEPAMRDLIRRRLREAGFDTAEAESAEAAIAAARDLHPAVITLDLILAGEDGWEVLARLRADATTRDIPVVVVSVVGGRQTALELGAMGYVAKPISKRELISTIRGVMPTLEGARVLCVDDEPASLGPLARVLKGAGAEVEIVRSAEAALEAVTGTRPDAVFVDLGMPGMSGFELVARLRSRPALSEVPLIVLTGRRLDDEDRLALDGHVDRVIRKGDLRLHDLAATVRQAVAHRRSRGAAEAVTA